LCRLHQQTAQVDVADRCRRTGSGADAAREKLRPGGCAGFYPCCSG
jgi:hypothetical protein